MTDELTNPGRVDFRAISDDPDFANVERVMSAVLARRGAESLPVPFGHGMLRVLVGHAGPLAAAAAILITASLTTLALVPTAAPESGPPQTLATWVQSNHVPTNGELLSTFEGYGR